MRCLTASPAPTAPAEVDRRIRIVGHVEGPFGGGGIRLGVEAAGVQALHPRVIDLHLGGVAGIEGPAQRVLAGRVAGLAQQRLRLVGVGLRPVRGASGVVLMAGEPRRQERCPVGSVRPKLSSLSGLAIGPGTERRSQGPADPDVGDLAVVCPEHMYAGCEARGEQLQSLSPCLVGSGYGVVGQGGPARWGAPSRMSSPCADSWWNLKT